MNDDERAVESWLHERGYDPTYEPVWLPEGRRPDFWGVTTLHEPSEIWVEVKRIDPDDTMAALSKHHALIKAVKLPSGLRGHAHIFIEPNAIEQSVQSVLRLFRQHVSQFAATTVKLVCIQQDRLGTVVHRVEVGGAEPTVLISRSVGQGAVHVPPGACRDSFAPAKVRYADGRVEEGPIYKFVEWTGDIECALTAHLDPLSTTAIDDITSFSAGSSQGSSRVLNALEQANSQIRTACQARAAPGLVILRPHGFLDDTQVAIAAYGKLTVPLTIKRATAVGSSIDSSVTQGDPFYGEDGVFRPTKNRHVSAAVRMGRDGPASFFRNPFANYRIPKSAPFFQGMVEGYEVD